MSRDDRARRVPAAVGAVLALPLFVARGLPMTDLPLHEGMVSLLVHRGDPSFTRGLYALNWGHTNQLFYLLAVPFALVVGSDLACRIVVAMTLVATFAAAARLCDHLGTSRWAALLVAPAAMGWTFFFGFVSNTLGVALFLFMLPSLDRFAETPTWRRALGASGTILLLHAAHEASVMCACVALAVLSAGRRGDLRAWSLRAVPIAFAALLGAIETRIEKPVLTAFARGWLDSGVQTHPLAKKLEYLCTLLMGSQGTVEEASIAALVVGAIAAFVVARRRTPAPAAPAPAIEAQEPPGFLVRARFELLAGALLALYAAAPYSINFGAFLYVRFLVPAYVIGALALARGSSPSRAAAALAAAVPLAWMIVVLPQFADAAEERRAVDSLLARIEEGSAVAVLGYGAQPEHAYDALTPGNRVLAVRGGRALHSFAEYPIAPVIVRRRARWDEPVIRVYRAPSTLRPAWDLTRFRYLLVRVGERDEAQGALASVIEQALAPDARLVAGAGAWRLFESTHLVVPIDAPDALLPVPPPPTIQERVGALLATTPTTRAE